VSWSSTTTPCRARVTQALGLRGFPAWAAAGAGEALAAYRAHREAIHVALLDVVLPGPDGPGTLVALRRLDPDLPALFISADPDRLTAGELAGMGVAGVVGKPVTDFDSLVRLLREAAGWPR
jgi:two-component system, OmpR family, response regulator